MHSRSGLEIKICDCHYDLVKGYTWTPYLCDSTGNRVKWRFKTWGILDGKYQQFLLHRIIMGFPTYGVDHADGDTQNNQCNNLRQSNVTQNNFNQKGAKHNSKSGYKGVYWHKAAQKWCAEVVYNHKKHYLGLFEDVKDAARAYNVKATELDLKFAYLNDIQE